MLLRMVQPRFGTQIRPGLVWGARAGDLKTDRFATAGGCGALRRALQAPGGASWGLGALVVELGALLDCYWVTDL